MMVQQLKSIIEGLLFMAGDEGLTIKQIAEIVEIDNRLSEDIVRELKADMEQSGRGIRIAEVAGAFRFTTHPDHAAYFERMAYSPSRSSLSQAALETLAIIAYRQPITRIEIEEIRGVKSEKAIQTLAAKDLVEEKGRAEQIGRPILYGTTRSFLDHFELGSLEALPEPSALTPEAELEEQTQLLFGRLDGRDMDSGKES
ncbi:SMC-Scp complex subunit ScpB [Paenibacillus pasadenensis]|nr:SMC-Scp complex subunit ScpB [Paenibacillus pasadenensis]